MNRDHVIWLYSLSLLITINESGKQIDSSFDLLAFTDTTAWALSLVDHPTLPTYAQGSLASRAGEYLTVGRGGRVLPEGA